MLKKYLMLFVLVISMVKTNAQVPYYYFRGKKIELQQENDKILIRLAPSATSQAIRSFENKISNDPNFQKASSGYAGFYMLKRKEGSSIAQADAINYYINDPAVAYASFMYNKPNASDIGITDEVFAKPRPGLSTGQLTDLANQYGLQYMQQNKYNPNLFHLHFAKNSRLNTLEIADALYETGMFEFVQPGMFGSINMTSLSSSSCPGSYTTPGDTYFGDQWALNNNGTYLSGACSNEDIDICNAWNITTGDGSVVSDYGTNTNVAIIDGGVDMLHPDLVGSMHTVGFVSYGGGSVPVPLGHDATYDVSSLSLYPLPCVYCGGGAYSPYYLYSGGNPGIPDGDDAHGTMCAGIIGARQNSIGISGVAPQTNIIPVRISYMDYTYGCPELHLFYNGWAYDGIEWAISIPNVQVDVLNCSWSWGYYDNLIDDAIIDAVTYGRGGSVSSHIPGKGCVVVCSAGNENNSTINWPSSHPDVISVGASTMCATRKRSTNNASMLAGTGVTADPVGVSCDNQWWWGSNYGYGAGYPSSSTDDYGFLSVMAPGVDIYTTALSSLAASGWFDHYCVHQTAEYNETFDGTSAAAPHVAGVAALILSVNQCLRWDEVKAIIERTADKINPCSGGSIYSYSYSMPNGSWDPQVGYGRVNAGNAATIAHDVYKQNKIEGSGVTKVYEGSHKVFSGYHVTDAVSQGYYTVGTHANITFHSAEAITLSPGFSTAFASGGSLFLAEINGGCVSTDSHFRLANQNNNSERPIIYGTAMADVEIYPNPVQNQLNISFILPQDDNVSFSISNILGQQIGNEHNFSLQAGKQIQTLQTNQLIPGVYLISVKTSNGNSEFRFVKE